MHSIRLCVRPPHLYRTLTSLLTKQTKSSLNAFYSSSNIPETDQFKAAVLHPKKQNLTVESLVLTDKATDNLVRIGIDYCAVNSVDVKCVYKEIDSVTLPFIPGTEYSGEILEIGPKCVQNFKVGDKVVVNSGLKHVGGGFAHECFAPETECTHIDPRLSLENAATIVHGYTNALVAFTKYMSLREGDEILICAGPGGSGLAAIEVAHKIFKANVYVMFSSASVNALVRDDAAYRAVNCNLGLTKVYNFFKNSLKAKKFKAVFDTTDSSLLHVVADFIDPNGYFLTDDSFFSADTFQAPYFKKDINKKGRKASLEEIEEPENVEWISRVKYVDATKYQSTDPAFYDATVKQVFDLYATEKIDPFVSKIFSLRDVNKAVQFVHQKKCLGKVLLDTDRSKVNKTQ